MHQRGMPGTMPHLLSGHLAGALRSGGGALAGGSSRGGGGRLGTLGLQRERREVCWAGGDLLVLL